MTKFFGAVALAAVASVSFGAGLIGPIDNENNPESVSVYSGEMVSMTSNVTNGADEVHLTVTDSNDVVHYEYTLSPDDFGQVTFDWFPLFDGTFTVEAESYLGGVSLGTESLAIVSAVRPDAAGFVTGGGWFDQSGRDTFGFVAQVMKNGTIRGNMEFQDHAGHNNWKSTSLDWVYVESPNVAYFSGWATRNQHDNYRFFVEVHDNGEPGVNDVYHLWVYDEFGGLQFTYSGVLSGGNVQIHKK